MPTIGKLKKGDLSIAGEVNERLPAVLDGLIAHFPFDGVAKKYIPGEIRYIRDWTGGSNVNAGNHWVELQAIDFQGANKALNKIVTTNGVISNVTYIVDGDAATVGNFTYITPEDRIARYIQIDLGDLYNIKQIKIWRYWADGRTYNKTKTEVSDDGIHWYSVFDSAIEGEYAETAAGKTIDLVNPGITCVPSTNDNNTLTDDGIAVEESTTNLISFGNSFDANQTLWYADTQPLGKTWNDCWDKIKGAYRVGRNIIAYRLATKSMKLATTLTADTTFTWSWERLGYMYSRYIEFSKDNGATWYGLNSGQGGSLISASDFANFEGSNQVHFNGDGSAVGVKKQWTKEWITFSLPIGTTHMKFSYDGYNADIVYPPGGWVRKIQCEQKTFATSFTPSSRAANGKFTLNNNGEKLVSLMNGGSIVINFKIGRFFNWDVFFRLRQIPYAAELFMDSGKYIHWRPFSNQSEFSFLTSKNIGDNVCIICTWDNVGNCKMYEDGILKQSVTITLDRSGAFDNTIYIGLGNDNSYLTSSHLISSISFYNRPLTDLEAAKFSPKRRFSIDKNGNLKIFKITEKPVDIPNDAYYFPLGVNAKDEANVISPSAEANTVYEDGGVWSGSAVANLLLNAGFEMGNINYWGLDTKSGGGALSAVLGGHSGKYCGSFMTTGSETDSAYIYQAGGTAAAGNVHTVSAYVKGNRPFYFMIRYQNAAGDTITQDFNSGKIIPSPDKWTRYTFVGGAAPANTGKVSIGIRAYQGDAGTIFIDDIQLEQKSFASPFTPSSRSTSKLQFNLNRDLGLDWSTDWSLVYFKKAIGTYDDTLTKYCIESIGCNNNSVGGGYSYFGKSNGSNGIELYINNGTGGSYVNSGFTPSDFFNKWHMVAVTKSGSVMTVKFYGIDGTIKSRSYTGVTFTGGNYFVNQFGYDLMLGGWDNGNPSNAYFRDLIVAKRALTDAELTAIANKFMSSKKDVLQVQGRLSEGNTL